MGATPTSGVTEPARGGRERCERSLRSEPWAPRRRAASPSLRGEDVSGVSGRDELLAQLEFYWDHNLWPRLRGLTDDEYFWEPVPGCWSVRRRDDGTWSMDWEWPTPTPPPVTTIAWRLAHMGIQTLGIRA